MKKTSLAFLSALFAGNVFAQATPTPQPGPGWEIVWGVGVPISPLASVLIAISLAGATYAFARRKRGQSLIALCIAAIAGVFAMSGSLEAIAPAYLITAKSGSTVIYCSAPPSIDSASNGKLAANPAQTFDVEVQTNVQDGITLTTVRPFGEFNPTSANKVKPQGAPLYPQCQAGTLVLPGAPCTVPCPDLLG